MEIFARVGTTSNPLNLDIDTLEDVSLWVDCQWHVVGSISTPGHLKLHVRGQSHVEICGLVGALTVNVDDQSHVRCPRLVATAGEVWAHGQSSICLDLKDRRANVSLRGQSRAYLMGRPSAGAVAVHENSELHYSAFPR